MFLRPLCVAQKLGGETETQDSDQAVRVDGFDLSAVCLDFGGRER